MSKPRLKGPMMPVRLSLVADAEIRRRAAGRGMSPGRYLSDMIERSVTREPVSLDAKREADSRERHPSSQPADPDRCLHKMSTQVGTTGIRTCPGCLKTRGVDGVWR